ncbi:MAG: phosphoenolpyruvate carboxykinase (GTP) [SAR324 cluster bacterium]|nr:phosphoenolpyruvate carboxykinase (GTP) [SAR324 cluster bacterium]
MTTTHAGLRSWVDEAATLTGPERVHWCDGTSGEFEGLIGDMIATGDLIPLDAGTYPGCTLHRSDPDDVARTEHLTFICTADKADAGPNNNWMAPDEAHRKLDTLFAGSMKGRTMFVIPYCMGPPDSTFARAGVELTDSAYVAANMHIMTRVGKTALAKIEAGGSFVKGLHSVGDLSPERRFIMHFPQEMAIKSIGSGYGGNALLGKKCHALRLASWEAREQGWLAEHMVIMGVETPTGETHYVAAAFPSACGKTNLAMLIPPASHAGYRVHTVGEDIAWMHLGSDGRLWAINPEAGLFGVVPGTSEATNRNALAAIRSNTIFTNVALTRDGQPWWEGLTDTPPAGLTDWRGRRYDVANGTAAHPNSRFTVPARQLPSISSMWEAPEGVPITAILFGGRRASLAPLVYQSLNWRHGVFVGASAASETTAAAAGKVGVVRRDPMAMLPFCGYNMADYWAHWLSFAGKSQRLPAIFHVNWFRRDGKGNYIWPGFGENIRVLRWVLERATGGGKAVPSPIGYLPAEDGIDTRGLALAPDALRALTAVNPGEWLEELDGIEAFFAQFGERLPPELGAEARRIRGELQGG